MGDSIRDAAYYDAHRDDPDEWGDPIEPPVARNRKNLTATITVRFSAEEAEGIRRKAKAAGITYSEVVRKAVQEYTQSSSSFTIGMTYNVFAYARATSSSTQETFVTLNTGREEESRTVSSGATVDAR